RTVKALNLDAALPSLGVDPDDRDNTITSNDELLGFPAPALPTGLPVRLPAKHALVPVVFARIRNVVITDLDLRVDGCERALDVADGVRLVGPTHNLNVVLRHRPRSISRARGGDYAASR